MRYLITGLLGAITTAVIALFFVGNVWLFAGLLGVIIALAITLYTFGAVALGGWLYRDAMHRGADITLRAQQINDTWDARKMAALAQFGRDSIKVGQSGVTPSYPAFPALDGQFTIAGLLEDEPQEDN